MPSALLSQSEWKEKCDPGPLTEAREDEIMTMSTIVCDERILILRQQSASMPILKSNCIAIPQSTTNRRGPAYIPDALQHATFLLLRHDAHEHLPRSLEIMKIDETTEKMNFHNENEISLDV